MQSRKKKEPKNSLGLAGLFFVVFLFFLGLSLCFKIFFLVKNSNFDGSNTYNIKFENSNSSSFVSFSPQAKTISILVASRDAKIVAPIDGVINKNLDNDKLSSTLFKSIFSPYSHKDITVIDLFRLTIFSRTVPRNNVNTYDYSDDAKRVFSDPKIFEEGKSIEIINATDVPGLGNKLANFISSMGGNVILVKSEGVVNNSKILYFGNKSYTVERINKFINFKEEEVLKREVADVIIVIGKDGVNNLEF